MANERIHCDYQESNPKCLVDYCNGNEYCKACGTDCSTYDVENARKRDVLSNSTITSARPSQMSSKLSRRNLVDSSSLARIADLDRPLSLYKRAPHSDSWIKYAPKGRNIYNALQIKSLEDDDATPMCDLDAFFGTRTLLVKSFESSEILKKKEELLDMVGIDPDLPYDTYSSKGPVPGQAPPGIEINIGTFQVTLNSDDGVLFADNTHRGEQKDKNGAVTRTPIPLSMSTVLWWQWKQNVRQKNPGVNPNQLDYSKLKYFFRFNIVNTESKNILKEVVNGKKPGPITYGPDSQQDTDKNPFWALLGSPNGNGIGWFLIDHKKSMKGKTIESLTVWYDKPARKYYMWATIT